MTWIYMDGKGKSKVAVICLFFAVIALIFDGFFCKISYEKKLYEEQKKELSVIYPNLADELRENISYYAEKQTQAEIWMVLLVLLLVSITFIGSSLLLTSADKRRLAEVEMERKFIYEQLLNIQNGAVELLPFPEEIGSQSFRDVYEKLRELAYYLSDFRTEASQDIRYSCGQRIMGCSISEIITILWRQRLS